MNFEPRRSQDDATADEEQNKYAAQFLQHGGVEVIFSVVMSSFQKHVNGSFFFRV